MWFGLMPLPDRTGPADAVNLLIFFFVRSFVLVRSINVMVAIDDIFLVSPSVDLWSAILHDFLIDDLISLGDRVFLKCLCSKRFFQTLECAEHTYKWFQQNAYEMKKKQKNIRRRIPIKSPSEQIRCLCYDALRQPYFLTDNISIHFAIAPRFKFEVWVIPYRDFA